MSLRISRIRVRKTDPLIEDFLLDAEPLNLIYGHNEAGKTLITEFMIRCLFRTGKKSNWTTRNEWKPGRGSAVEVVCDNGDAVSFSLSSRKRLEDYLGVENSVLPPNLSKLMVVKGGELDFSNEAPEGINREILRTILSSEGLLDKIRSGLQAITGKAEYRNGEIHGVNSGIIAGRREKQEALKKIDALLSEAGERISGARTVDLKQRLERKRVERHLMEKAGSHRAFRLTKEIEHLNNQLSLLPDRDALDSAVSDMKLYRARKADLRTRLEEKGDLQEQISDLPWLRNAMKNYDECMELAGEKKPAATITVAMYSAFAAAAVSALLGWVVPGVLFILASVVLVLFRIRNLMSLMKTVSAPSAEIQKLAGEFENRFDRQLTDRVTLQTMIETQQKSADRIEYLEKEILDLELKLKTILAGVDPVLESNEASEDRKNREDELGAIIRNRNLLEQETAQKQRELGKLETAVLLEKSPGIEWDSDRYRELLSEVAGLESELEQSKEETDGFSRRVAVELDDTSSASLEDLVHALMEKRKTTADEYRRLTAKVIAEIQVHAVLDELSMKEDDLIRRGLRSDATIEAIRAITDYASADMDDEQNLILRPVDGGEPFRLEELSTGAREQVLLALRIGFISDILKKPGFLILDDAFQHSDWVRRERMVRMIIDLVHRGWQIFCFTMDDHIRDLFQRPVVTLTTKS